MGNYIALMFQHCFHRDNGGGGDERTHISINCACFKSNIDDDAPDCIEIRKEEE